MGVLNKTMLGTNEIYSSVMLDNDPDNPNLTNSDSAIYSDGTEGGTRKAIKSSEIGGLLWGDWKIPNMLYCPENIFSNKIPALDVNFIHPNTYYGVDGQEVDSYAKKLSSTIASWYKAFRNIAVVGLLCVLVYLGIRILIETSAQGKAKYKSLLQDWLVALCLVFAIHLIMSGTLMVIDKVTQLLTNSLGDSTIYVDVDNSIHFKTNITGYIRLLGQSKDWGDATAYTLIYFVLVIYTVMFTFTYLKRFLWMAFFTMIAPLVALTYPIDKAGDGHAQAFNMWFKEYIMNAILQPVHLLLYSVMVSSAISLAVDNPIYAIVAIAFLIPAEKFIKKMFGLNKGETAGGLGSFAGGAMTMKALESLGKGGPRPSSKLGDGKGKTGALENGKNKIRMNKRSTLESFKGLQSPESSTTTALAAAGAADKMTEDDTSDYPSIPSKTLSDEEQKQYQDKINNKVNDMNDKNSLEQEELYKNYAMNGNKLDELEGIKDEKPWTFQDAKENMKKDFYGTKLGTKVNKITSNKTARALGRTLIRGAKELPKNKRMIAKAGAGIARFGLKAAGSMVGSGIGIAAGIATGDFSKAAQYGLAGMVAGNKIGENTFNLGSKIGHGVYNVGQETLEKANKLRNIYEEERYGLGQAQQMQIDRQNEKARKEFLRDDDEKRKYKEIAAEMELKTGKSFTTEQIMNSAFDYKVAGMDDEQFKKGLELEAKHGGVGGENHDKIMDIMNLTGKFGQDYIMDEKKRTAMEGYVSSVVSNNKQQKEVMQLFAEAHGQGEYYARLQRKKFQKEPEPKTKSKIITGDQARAELNKGRANGTIHLGGN